MQNLAGARRAPGGPGEQDAEAQKCGIDRSSSGRSGNCCSKSAEAQKRAKAQAAQDAKIEEKAAKAAEVEKEAAASVVPRAGPGWHKLFDACG